MSVETPAKPSNQPDQIISAQPIQQPARLPAQPVNGRTAARPRPLIKLTASRLCVAVPAGTRLLLFSLSARTHARTPVVHCCPVQRVRFVPCPLPGCGAAPRTTALHCALHCRSAPTPLEPAATSASSHPNPNHRPLSANQLAFRVALNLAPSIAIAEAYHRRQPRSAALHWTRRPSGDKTCLRCPIISP